MKKVTGIAIAIALILAQAQSAKADAFTVTADKSNNLIGAGDTVVVTATGIPTGEGIYVRLCQGTLDSVKTARPENCFGQGSWASTDATQKAYGAVDALKPISLTVQSQFGSGASAVDCLKQACGIHIRRDHNGGSTDFSLDRFIPVTFNGSSSPSTTSASTAKALIIGAGKQTFVELSNIKGATVVISVGSKKYYKKYETDSAHFAANTPKGTFNVIVSVNGKVISTKKLKG